MRTIIEKYQRLAQIQQRYAEQIEELGKKQLSIHQRVLRELKLDSHYDNRDVMHYDFLRVEEDGAVGLWENGRCGDSDSQSTSINIHPLIVNGDLEGYERDLRASLNSQAKKALEAKEKETEQRRKKLQSEICRMNDELGKLNS